MPIVYKIDVIPALKEKGYNTNAIRQQHLFGESVLQQFRKKQLVSWKNMEQLCRLLECQPGDILEYVAEELGK